MNWIRSNINFLPCQPSPLRSLKKLLPQLKFTKRKWIR
ncbi:hypothetical protein FBUS_11414 [Fasciolopsis buskii]|uniref:Uncharacterized protein n=1 Tax=Fasciolopsis buskii TaxID=27845 RepID=A0A8E0RVA4_9TREM|nr:hypothetical protein FBUS_11414 [Fasciolopsis buski]